MSSTTGAQAPRASTVQARFQFTPHSHHATQASSRAWRSASAPTPMSGGYANASLAAEARQCQTVQLFTKSSNQWRAKELTPDDIRTFRRTLRRTRLRQAMAHDCYLINLASPDAELYRRSIE